MQSKMTGWRGGSSLASSSERDDAALRHNSILLHGEAFTRPALRRAVLTLRPVSGPATVPGRFPGSEAERSLARNGIRRSGNEDIGGVELLRFETLRPVLLDIGLELRRVHGIVLNEELRVGLGRGNRRWRGRIRLRPGALICAVVLSALAGLHHVPVGHQALRRPALWD